MPPKKLTSEQSAALFKKRRDEAAFVSSEEEKAVFSHIQANVNRETPPPLTAQATTLFLALTKYNNNQIHLSTEDESILNSYIDSLNKHIVHDIDFDNELLKNTYQLRDVLASNRLKDRKDTDKTYYCDSLIINLETFGKTIGDSLKSAAKNPNMRTSSLGKK